MSGTTQEFLGSLTPLVTIALVFVAVVISARRFVKRREREGEWDANGPRHPTEPPARFQRLPGYYSERPEIVTEEAPEPPDGEEFDATVFLSSTAGFTARSATARPSEIVASTNAIHEKVTNAVLAEDGVVVKYLGDGLLAYFDGENAERRAVRAALAASTAVSGSLCVGLVIGPVARAKIGHSEHAQLDLVGATVNSAFRVLDWASKSTQSHIAVLGEDARDLDDEFELRENDWVALKGLPETETIFEVVAKRR
ncbi:MAG: adenylate/guanylate cyclase domain-containing protein [Gemmatimonadaceae bacterium]